MATSYLFHSPLTTHHSPLTTHHLLRHYPYYLLLIAICASAILVVGGSPEELKMRWQILAYFSVVSFGFHYGLVKSSVGRPQNFIRYYMAATTFKLLIHLSVILIYALTHKSNAIPFMISFMIAYAVFTAFEVVTAMKQRKS
jgi:hypothetical protein